MIVFKTDHYFVGVGIGGQGVEPPVKENLGQAIVVALILS